MFEESLRELGTKKLNRYGECICLLAEMPDKTVKKVLPPLVELYQSLYRLGCPRQVALDRGEDLAYTVYLLIPESKFMWDDEVDPGVEYPGTHCFIFYRGKYYDAEQVNGVKHWKNLPYFARLRDQGASQNGKEKGHQEKTSRKRQTQKSSGTTSGGVRGPRRTVRPAKVGEGQEDRDKLTAQMACLYFGRAVSDRRYRKSKRSAAGV